MPYFRRSTLYKCTYLLTYLLTKLPKLIDWCAVRQCQYQSLSYVAHSRESNALSTPVDSVD